MLTKEEQELWKTTWKRERDGLIDI